MLDDNPLVVTTQFASWASQLDSAKERPDILALSSSGELVVIELKRGGDSRIHLQALTYAALVAGFTKAQLSQAHANWLTNRTDTPVSAAEALQLLEQHLDDSDWSEEP